MKKIFFIALAYLSSAQTFATNAETAFWVQRVDDDLRLGWNDLIGTINNILWYIVGLLYFISIIFAIYAWFLILTSGWDEERVKKGKKMFLYVIAWIILIMLASQIINFVINLLNTETAWNVIANIILL